LDGQDFAVLLSVKGAYNTQGMEHGFFFRDRKMVVLEGVLSLTPIPEPSTAVLLVLGLAGLSLGERRTRALRA
jgi:PEP-CTERM motif